ncbi:MAG: hypothetical protein ACQEP1_01710 [Nanobdellota archaeon]
MKLSELAGLMGKSEDEVKGILDSQDTVKVDLKDGKRKKKERGKIEVVS